MRRIWVCLTIALCILAFAACQREGGTKEVRQGGPIVKAGTAPDGSVQTPGTGGVENGESSAIAFDSTDFDFGTVEEGDKVEHVFNFKNTGKGGLHVENVRSS